MSSEILDLFETAPDEVKRAAVEIRVKKGETVLGLNEENRCLYILLEGETEVYRENSNYCTAVLYTYRPGEFFGEMELFGEEPAALEVAAKKDSRLLKLHRDYVLLWMKKDFDFTLTICRKLAATDYGNRFTINGMKPLPLRYRYLYMLRQAKQAGELDGLTKAAMCARLGTDIRCVNRVAAEYRKMGIAGYENHHFRIMDEEKLLEILEEYGLG